MTIGLQDDLREQVLRGLGLAAPPDPDLGGLTAVYAAWCERVPFDNLQKRIHVAAGAGGPLPGHTSAAFFANWLAHGTGGTCWSGSGALQALLTALGFDARLALGTMLPGTSPPDPATIPALLKPMFAGPQPTREPSPNHGSVVVVLDGDSYLVDSSIVHAAPLHLDPGQPTRVEHPVAGVDCQPTGDGRFVIEWRPLHMPTGMRCRIESLAIEREELERRHDATRSWSPFNFSLSTRVLHDGRVIGLAFGAPRALPVEAGPNGEFRSADERRAFLVDVLGYSEQVVDRLPDCVPLPPPPGHA